ncbi:DUF2971 domain-containing protein, partial [Microbulbifer sp. OS29]
METIYHYTDVHGLFGILNRNQFWLTDNRFLNDSTEGVYAKEILETHKKKLFSQLDETAQEKIYTALTISTPFETGEKVVFTGSFSTEPNLLSQWRGYCSKEGGYAIGFDFNELRKLSEDYDISSCTYVAEDAVKLWKSLISDFQKMENKIQESILKGEPERLIVESLREDYIQFFLTRVFLQIICKHPDYNEEKEIRIIKFLKAGAKDIFFHPSNAGLSHINRCKNEQNRPR